MCGFCGFTGCNEQAGKIIQAMMDKIIHRGPDAAGEYLGGDITLGFRRLSIIGLEDGGQPMFNEDKTLALVFNGEIYNYQELRAALEEKGHAFSTHSDTETILHLYEEHGPGLLTYLRGMFAFALYDIKARTLFCARDPFGIKPFYYTAIDEGTEVNPVFMFGSEIKCFTAHPAFKSIMNEQALAAYLTFQYSVLPETFFKGVYKLPPAHYLIYQNGELSVTRYFSPVFSPADMTLEQAVADADGAVCDSVAKHMVSDVEVGSFLSGGVDSSYIAACFKECPSAYGHKTFTVGFDYEKYNEIGHARALSEKINVNHYARLISTDEYWEHLPKVQYHMDEPLADPSAVALYFVSQEASRHVKVALSGEGADEFFGGYNIYREPLGLKALTSLPMWLRRWLGRMAARIPFAVKGKNFFIRGSKTLEERFIGNAYIFTPAERESLLKPGVGEGAPGPGDITAPYYKQAAFNDEITKMQYLDIHLWMVGDILLKADKMSMAHSLEVRVPFLDREVFRAASCMPVAYRVHKRGTKYAFRRAAAKHVPEDTAERKKLGFPVPIRVWLREEKYYARVRDSFEGAAARRYFNTNTLISLLDKHRAGKGDYSRKLWTVYMFLLWHEQYFDAA
jgi:asparagine synthase (glutamine-hydrolysing)